MSRRPVASIAFGFVFVVGVAGACSSTTHRSTPTTRASSTARASSSTTAPAHATTAKPTTKPTTTTNSVPASTPHTTPTTVSPPPATHGLRGAVITINPGHDGGNASHPSEINRMVWIGTGRKACDTAGTETNDGYTEHAFNWDVSNRVATKLRAFGATVILTRTNDTGVGPCIDERAAIGNRARSAAVVSIHADGGPSNGRGFFVIAPALLQGLTDNIYSSSGRLASDVRDAVQRDTPMPRSNYAGSDGYMTSAIYGGLNLTDVPAMFIECGNMRNGSDAALLESSTFRDQLASAIAAGISTFVT